MSNFKALDKDSLTIEFSADGTGTDLDPFVPHHKVTESALPNGAATAAYQEEQNTKLEEIKTKLEDLRSYTDNLETLLTNLNGYVDGLEALLVTANATQTSVADFVDQLEEFVDGIETKLDALNTKDFATQETLNLLLLELQGKADLVEIQPVAVSNFPTIQPISLPDAPLITESPLTAVGSTPARNVAGYKYLTYQVDVVGIGSNVVVRAEGNLTGSNFVNLNPNNVDTVLTQNKPELFTFEGKISQIRFTLVSFSGGSPSLTCHLLKGN